MKTQKEFLKMRKKIGDCCGRKRPISDRTKYGTNRCDAFSMHSTLEIVLSNYLYQYLADASQIIVRDDWDIIEKHAAAIRAYSDSDSWDELPTAEKEAKKKRKKERRDFEEAMKWLIKEWDGLWW